MDTLLKQNVTVFEIGVVEHCADVEFPRKMEQTTHTSHTAHIQVSCPSGRFTYTLGQQ